MVQSLSENTRVLLVESDTGHRKTQMALLRDIGLEEILTTTNGTEAWSMLKNYGVNLIISSWNLLEDMNGLVLLKVVRADRAFSTIPFLMVVEEITKAQVIEAGEAGVTEMILRPFSGDLFKRKVDMTLNPDEDQEQKESKKLLSQGTELMKQGRHEEALKTFKTHPQPARKRRSILQHGLYQDRPGPIRRSHHRLPQGNSDQFSIRAGVPENGRSL